MLLVTESNILATHAALKAAGTRLERHEGVVYWAGRSAGQDRVALATVVPRADTAPGNFRVSVESNARAISWMCEHSLELVAQVHSHPGPWVDHSKWDDDHAPFPFEGLWSIVVPDYARDGLLPIERCGVHRYDCGRFRRLDAAESASVIRVVATVGDLR